MREAGGPWAIAAIILMAALLAAAPLAAPGRAAELAQAASDSPAIDDLDDIPFLAPDDEAGHQAYRQFLAAPLPRAFVFATSGQWVWRYGTNAADTAMSICRSSTPAACVLYALDNRVVWRFDPKAASYADEATDWGVPPTRSLRTDQYHAPTPTAVPGAATINTRELRKLMDSGREPVILDVLGGTRHFTLPGAAWVGDAGLGYARNSAYQQRFARLLAQLTNGDKAKELVTLCLGAYCWLSYNAALRAVSLGYSHVYWYRGGTFAWRASGQPLVEARAYPLPE
ncbi:MAG: rhodanese-like domain-containing protein [Alphaproteobacteria bacterium]